jgi:hypothetical protein
VYDIALLAACKAPVLPSPSINDLKPFVPLPNRMSKGNRLCCTPASFLDPNLLRRKVSNLVHYSSGWHSGKESSNITTY